MTAPAISLPRDATRDAQLRERFTSTLRSAAERRGHGAMDLARLASTNHSSSAMWLRGETIPRHSTVVQLADVLDCPALVSISLALRSRQCLICPARFVQQSGKDRVFCGERCRHVASKRRRAGHSLESVAVLRHRLETHTTAVRKHCMDCTQGDGLCPLWTCKLRGVSPLPLTAEARRAQDLARAAAAAR